MGKKANFQGFRILIFGLIVFCPAQAFCVGLVPSAAEVDRIKPLENRPIEIRPKEEPITKDNNQPKDNAPQGAEKIKLLLKDIEIIGSTVFTKEELRKLYSEYLDKEVSLSVIWIAAERITKKYHDEGYFLSRAYVPMQEIDHGIVKINVIEGFVGEVEIESDLKNNFILEELVKDIKSKKPVKANELESFLLRLNDLPSANFKGILAPSNIDDEAAVLVKLISSDKDNQANIRIDNYGSRFLGPQQLTASYQASFLPMHQTNFALVNSSQFDELTYGSLEHLINISPEIKLGLNFSQTYAEPGYILEDYNINSRSTEYSASIYYQPIRQRLSNLLFNLNFEARNANTTLLDSQISHDHVRSISLGVSYDFFDDWNGYNTANLTFTRGLDLFDSSQEGDRNLSRAGAKPNFKKINMFLARQQSLFSETTLISSLTAQASSGTLYSSSTFGYGGQSFGRAYDSSVITGDHGIAAAFELRYNNFDLMEDLKLSPYIFYDIGKVWNVNPAAGQEKESSGSSAGLGLRTDFIENTSANLGLAFPLTRDIETPIYDSENIDYRILFLLSKSF